MRQVQVSVVFQQKDDEDRLRTIHLNFFGDSISDTLTRALNFSKTVGLISSVDLLAVDLECVSI